MQRRQIVAQGFLLIGLPLATPAAEYFRCVDEQGHIAFSDQSCPNGERLVVEAANRLPAPSDTARAANGSTGRLSGQRQASPCGNLLDPRERRAAQIRQEVRAGMSRSEIESAFGKPATVRHHNGQTRYQYRDEQGGLRSVHFDEHGCVKAGG